MKTLRKTLIVDDEKPARERLKRLLKAYGSFFDVVGEATDSVEAAEKIEILTPDIVFLDIQMPGPSVFEMLATLQHKPVVVFCTAYDSYALEAFGTFSIDYLLKPVEAERLDLTVSKLEKFESGHNEAWFKNLESFRVQVPEPVSIAHKLGNKIIPVKLEEVIYFEASEKYVNFFNSAGDSYMTDQTLASLSLKLPKNFIRISKSHLINRNHVLEIQKYFRGRFVFMMDDKKRSKIISGQVYSDDIRKVFDI